MKVLIAFVLLALVLLPGAARAVDQLGCDVWLETGNVLMWAACRVSEWVAFNESTELEYYYGITV